jgi:hypothetical protein
MTKKDKQGASNAQRVYKYLGIGMYWLVMLGLSFALGYWLDKQTTWKFPIFVVTLPVLALAYLIYQLVKQLNKDNF